MRATGLVKRFRGEVAVAGVDLEVGAGGHVALLGPNGAGKTTTLFMLLGVVTPDAGSVELVGHRLPEGRTAALAQVGFAAGYLPLAERIRVRGIPPHVRGPLRSVPTDRRHRRRS